MAIHREEKKPNYKAYLHKIKAFAFDVDGVFTDGSVLALPDGDLLRAHNAKDGFAVKMAVKNKYPIAIITGGDSESVRIRFSKLGVTDIYMKSRNNVPDFLKFCEKHHLQPEEVAFVGDDLPDRPVLEICGLAVCPSDAVDEVKEVCDFISPFGGGRGCVRNLIEQVMKVHETWHFDPIVYSE